MYMNCVALWTAQGFTKTKWNSNSRSLQVYLFFTQGLNNAPRLLGPLREMMEKGSLSSSPSCSSSCSFRVTCPSPPPHPPPPSHPSPPSTFSLTLPLNKRCVAMEKKEEKNNTFEWHLSVRRLYPSLNILGSSGQKGKQISGAKVCYLCLWHTVKYVIKANCGHTI